MKKKLSIFLAVMMIVSVLSSCGRKDTKERDVDLESFMDELSMEYQWGAAMAPITGEVLDTYYPGLSAIPTKQLVGVMPQMGSVVNEILLVRCESEEDAEKVAEIMQARIDYQVGDDENPGGAWYPESIEGWKKAEIEQEGTYVAMIASAQNQSEITEKFNKLFE